MFGKVGPSSAVEKCLRTWFPATAGTPTTVPPTTVPPTTVPEKQGDVGSSKDPKYSRDATKIWMLWKQ
jgi:hypothetical protein